MTYARQEMEGFLHIQHNLVKGIARDSLIYPPVGRLHKVLDLGYGTGSWAIEVANDYPGAEVSLNL